MIDSFDDRSLGEVADDERFDERPWSFVGQCINCGKTTEIHPEAHECADCLERGTEECDQKHDFSSR